MTLSGCSAYLGATLAACNFLVALLAEIDEAHHYYCQYWGALADLFRSEELTGNAVQTKGNGNKGNDVLSEGVTAVGREMVAALLLGRLVGAALHLNGAGCNSESHGGNSEDSLGELHFENVFWSGGYRCDCVFGMLVMEAGD